MAKTLDVPLYLYPIYDGLSILVIMDIYGYSIYQSYDIYDGLTILVGGLPTPLKNMNQLG